MTTKRNREKYTMKHNHHFASNNNHFAAYRRKDYVTPRSTQEAYGDWVEIYVEEDEEAAMKRIWDWIVFAGGCLVWGVVGAMVLAVVLYYGGK